MKTLLKTLVLTTTLVLTAPAVMAHQHGSDSGHHGNMAKGKMDMQKMQTHMNEMQSVLDKARVETDPAKRQQLLHEHARKMESMMSMMGPMVSDSADHNMHKKGKHSMSKDMTDQQRMAMMEKRLVMMEKMMGQMMGNAAESSKKVHKHKKN